MDPIILHRAYKYQIFPNEQQKVQLAQTFGCVRKVYNMGLELQQGLYGAGMGSLSQNSLNNYCTRQWKEEFPFLRDVDKFALTNSLMHLTAAYKNFFEGRTGFPKFKEKRNTEQTYTTNMTNSNIAIFPGKKKNSGQIKLPKLGLVDACLYRLPEEDWVIKHATVIKDCHGKYFVSVAFDVLVEAPAEVIPTKGTTLGLDYSSPDFYVDSTGQSPEVPHPYRRMEKRLAREQRRLSHMVRGSNNYEKQRLLISRLHERVANQRKNFCHQQSRKIANSWAAVCVEDLDLKAMAQSLRFGKAVMDNGFGMFRTFLKYKLEEQGKHYIVVDKWYPSSKTCNHCGNYNPAVVLGVDEWICPCCGRLIKRDPNAAQNIRDKGLRMLQMQPAA